MKNLNITTTENKAIQLAKSILKNDNNVKRLAYSIVKSTSCQCACGETGAVNVTAQIKGQWYDVTVGYCSACGEK